MKLLPFYESILRATGHDISQEGFISRKLYGTDVATLVDTQHLVLPTQANMMNKDQLKIVTFHPLYEDLMRGPSKVLDYFRRAIRVELESRFMILIMDVLTLINRTDLHQFVSPDEADILNAAKKVDETAITMFMKIVENLDEDARDKMLLHLYLRRGGKLNGKGYRQFATVTFPFYEYLCTEPQKKEGYRFADVKLRNSDVTVYKGVMEYIIPAISTEGGYSYGSNESVAPKLHCLLGAMAFIVQAFNAVAGILMRVQTESKSTEDIFVTDSLIPSEWISSLDHFDVLWKEARNIPMQPGNEGDISAHDRGFADVDQIKAVDNPALIGDMSKNAYVKAIDPQAPKPPQAPQEPQASQAPKANPNVSVKDLMRGAFGRGAGGGGNKTEVQQPQAPVTHNPPVKATYSEREPQPPMLTPPQYPGYPGMAPGMMPMGMAPGMQPGMGYPGMPQPGMMPTQPQPQPQSQEPRRGSIAGIGGSMMPAMAPGMVPAGQPGMMPGMVPMGYPGMAQPGMMPMPQPGMGYPGMVPAGMAPGMGYPGMAPGMTPMYPSGMTPMAPTTMTNQPFGAPGMPFAYYGSR